MFYFLCSIINGIALTYFASVFISSFKMQENPAFFAVVSFVATLYCLGKFLFYLSLTGNSFYKYSNRKMYTNLFRIGEQEKDLQIGFYRRWPKPEQIPDNLLPHYIKALMQEIKNTQEARSKNGS